MAGVMSCPDVGSTDPGAATAGVAAAGDRRAIEHAFEAIVAELALIAGNPDRVDAACAVLAGQRAAWDLPPVAARFEQLATIARRAPRALTPTLLGLLHDVACARPEAWPILSHLVSSIDPLVRDDALERVRRLLAAGRFDPGDLFDGLARVVQEGPDGLREQGVLAHVHSVLGDSPGGAAPLEAICLDSPHASSRRLAARLLDLSPSLPSTRIARLLLGAPLAAFLEPYLAYTRATHLDLLDFALGHQDQAAMLADLQAAEALAGTALLREVVGELGWRSLNAGLSVSRTVLVCAGESFPLVVTPPDASLLGGCPGVRRLGERLVFVARGAEAQDADSSGSDSSAVARFRACNLRHADVLADLLDLAPLTSDKVTRMVGRMDGIVSDFCALFSAHTDECDTIRATYGRIRQQILRRLAEAQPGEPLDAELTRLVQMFEDPDSAAAIRTLHGCKRYLHQRGLRLGFKLAEAGRSTNRTVTLAVARDGRVLGVLRAIEYVDFEPRADAPGLPHLVGVAARAFAHHLLHGESSFPKLKFFCYGNEVHCFATFRNHPAFIRLDFSPPQRGGMIDLEYCGVSKFDLDWHPNPSLTAIETIFRRFDFDIQVTDTRIRARFDKERASSLRQLSEKVDGLFRLVPSLMDLDWIVGDLQLSTGARKEVAEAWAEFFARWGILPLRHVLTSDRLGILVGVQHDPAGDREIRWTGADPYHDRFTVPAPAGFWPALAERLSEEGLAHLVALPADGPVSQLAIESILVEPLERAVARGELARSSEGYALTPPSLFRPVHEARLLAEALGAPDAALAAAARLARLAAMLEGQLQFDVTGTVNGYEVQRAVLSLPGQTAAICGLRDSGGILQAALFVEGEAPCEQRDAATSPWRANWTFEAEVLSAVLRRSNYAPPWVDAAPEPAGAVAARVRAAFAGTNVHARPAPLPGERLVGGVKASPGRAVGIARVGLARRRAADVSGGIIIEAALSPADNPFVFRSAGIVTTGGGILSHAGLIALQFHKPAVVVAGRLERLASGSEALVCTRRERRDRRVLVGSCDVIEQHQVSTHEDRMEEGDLVVVDGDAGTMLVLGQQPDTLAMHVELQRLAASARKLATARADQEVLVQRGAMLRARHQLERLLGRLGDDVLARHAATELLIGEAGTDPAVHPSDKVRLVSVLCGNQRVSATARAAIADLRRRIERRLQALVDAAAQLIPSAADPVEVLALRVDLLRTARLLDSVSGVLEGAEVGGAPAGRPDLAQVESLAWQRLRALRDEALAEATARAAGGHGLTHVLRQIDRVDEVTGAAAGAPRSPAPLRAQCAAAAEAACRRAADALVLWPGDGGAELWPVVGAKAANLAEAARLGDPALIPGWFVVTDRAFRDVLDRPLPGGRARLRDLIERTLATRDPDVQKAQVIRRAFDAVEVPAELIAALASAYGRLAGAGPAAPGEPDDDPLRPFVAVRSSSREEDAESAARAGEFDTFLFVRGEAALVEHLKRAWSGLWNERAIHTRAALGVVGEVGGGILVQRMVWARVSGVLHTINLAAGQWREMVINAGLGLGEGIVSGAVAADQVVVSKDGASPSDTLRFRYITNDKRERVVFDRACGLGTRRVDTLYHQRLRPALEYVELCDLVRAARRLEAGFRQPLDIEFAFEGQHLRLLQVRPIPAAYAVWRDTVERYPLSGRPA